MKKTYRISIWSIVVLALLVGGLALFALYSWSRVAQINAASTAIERNWLPSTRLLGQMEVDALAYRVAAMQHVLSLQDEARALYESFGSAWSRHLEESQAALALSRENQEAATVLRQEPQALFEEADAHLEGLIVLNVETSNSISRRGDDILGEFQLALVMLLILGGTLLLLFFADVFGKRSEASHLP